MLFHWLILLISPKLFKDSCCLRVHVSISITLSLSYTVQLEIAKQSGGIHRACSHSFVGYIPHVHVFALLCIVDDYNILYNAFVYVCM